MAQGYHRKNGALFADDVDLAHIAKVAGTPTYVYCASVIRAQYQRLHTAMTAAVPKGRFRPYYAAKANSNLAVLHVLQKLGAGLEIVSEGELMRGLAAGFKGADIVSTSYGKTEPEINACLKAGLLQLNIECEAELERINHCAGALGLKAPVVFRFNPNVRGGGHSKITTGRKSDKFGLSAAQVAELYARAMQLAHVKALGLQMHIGSQVFTVESFKTAFETLAALTRDLRAKNLPVERLDIGGGFPIVYKDEQLLDLEAYAQWVRDIIVPLDVDVQLEPGRYLTGNAGVLLSEVIYIKQTEERRFAVLDAGMNDLIRPAMYDAYHGITPLTNADRPCLDYDVTGPLCESSDFYAKGRMIPELRAGDLVAVETAGAYGFCMASNYNTRPLPAEVMVDGNRFEIIRPRAALPDLFRDEKIPAWL